MLRPSAPKGRGLLRMISIFLLFGWALLAGCSIYREYAGSSAARLQNAGDKVALPTLGGGFAEAHTINAHRWVVGSSFADGGGGRAVLWRNGVIKSLGVLARGDFSTASGVNDSGWVVGTSAIDRPRASPDVLHAFLWRNGKMQNLGTLGGSESLAAAVNDIGWIVGAAQIAAPKSGVRPPDHAFLWRNGRMRDLGTLGGPESAAAAVSSNGWIVGDAQIAASKSGVKPPHHAFLWRNGKMQDLGTLGGPESGGAAVNDRGWIIGNSQIAVPESGVTPPEHAFLWRNGKMQDLGTLGGNRSQARGINSAGTIVGLSYTSRDGAAHAFVWTRSRGLQDLNPLLQRTGGWPRPSVGTDVFSLANGINEAGDIVGEFGVGLGESTAFLLPLRDLKGLGYEKVPAIRPEGPAGVPRGTLAR